MKEEEKKIEKCKFSHYHLNDEFHCVQEGWDDDKVKVVNEAQCEACEHFKSRYIEYPITVNKLDIDPVKYEDSWHCKVGSLVAVRPCGEEYGNKTYLGIYIGDLPLQYFASYLESEGILHCYPFTNPAMFVPELGKIIWGCGSWWSKIETEEDLRQITDEDIDNVWYVKMMKNMSERKDS